MSLTRKQVRIMSLGEITTPDIRKTIQAFAGLIGNKNPSLNSIATSISNIIQQNMRTIDDFKLGVLSDSDFTKQMINNLKNETGVELTIHEFNQAWNAMNPKLEQFEILLKQAIEYNKPPDQQIIFISFTNPKDIEHLISELKKSNISYETNDGQLVKIGGIQLLTTYYTKQTKASLIETTINKLTSKLLQSTLAHSMSKGLNLEQDDKLEPKIDIKYIRCINNISDPILKDNLNKTNEEVEKTVDTILWIKEEKTLFDVLYNPQESKNIPIAKL